jgi:hypothetical protein
MALYRSASVGISENSINLINKSLIIRVIIKYLMTCYEECDPNESPGNGFSRG